MTPTPAPRRSRSHAPLALPALSASLGNRAPGFLVILGVTPTDQTSADFLSANGH
jgi:hypothetical protein